MNRCRKQNNPNFLLATALSAAICSVSSPALSNELNTSPYAFDFSEYVEWKGDVVTGPATSGIYIEDLGQDNWVANVKATGGAGTQVITYSNYVSTGQNYLLQFRAKIDSYDSGNSWPLRVIVKDGTHNLILAFEDDGIYYFDGDGVKTYLTTEPAIGVWKSYTVKVNRGSASLYIGNSPAVSIPSLKPLVTTPSIQLSARGDTSNVAAQVSSLAVIPKRLTFTEEWENTNDWAISSGSSYDYATVSSGADNYLNIVSGTTGGSNIDNLQHPVSENYSIRTQVRVNDFGNGDWPLRLTGFNGTKMADIRFEQNGDLTVRSSNGTYVQNSANRTVAAGEKIALEVRVLGDNAELWELKPAGNIPLHAWLLPNSAGSDRVRLNSNGSNASVDVFHIDYSDETLVDHSNNAAAHAFINFANGEEFGISKLGGGYGSQLRLSSGGPNILSSGYGAGWVSALRSKLHGDGNYNPTQAGASDAEGAPTTLNKSTNANGGDVVSVDIFQTPLFVLDSRMNDWIENEPLISTDGTRFFDKNFSDGGNSDIDGIDESFRSMADEIRSELDFLGEWEDATSLSTTGKSILRHYVRWDYKKNPDALLQFNKAANLIEESYRVSDLSPSHYSGDQTPTDIDMSMLLNTYSIRLEKADGYKYFMWKQDGVWQSVLADSSWLDVGIAGTDENADPYLNPVALGLVAAKNPNLADQADSDFMVISKTGQPDDPHAVGLYIPWHNNTNSKEVVGYDRATDALVFSEDRRINAYFTVSLRNAQWMTVFVRMWHLGLQAPDHGNADVYESLQGEFFHVMGTPDEIADTVAELDAIGVPPEPIVRGRGCGLHLGQDTPPKRAQRSPGSPCRQNQ